MTTILDLFASSPVKPMQTHMAKVLECTQHLVQFFDAVVDEDWEKGQACQQRIAELEHEADELKKELRLHLPKGLFLPVARTDLLALLDAQDKIANKAKDVAGLMTGRQMKVPQALHGHFKEYLLQSIAVVEQAAKAIKQLDELLETGFKGRVVTLVEEMVEKLDTVENEVDAMQVKVRRSLFEIESQLPPVEVIFLYKVIDWVGDISDRAQQVGSRLLLLLAR